MAVRQGELDLHGRPRNVTWVRLAQTANKNSSLLHVLEPVDWISGDQIVIASTTKDGNETEVSCSNDKRLFINVSNIRQTLLPMLQVMVLQ